MQQRYAMPETYPDRLQSAATEASAFISADENVLVDRNVSSSTFFQRAQSISIFISLILSPVAIILVSDWVSILGGVSWAEGDAKRVFNWHPVMMVTAYAIMNVGTLIFRVSGTSSYQASSLQSSTPRNVPATSTATSADPKKRRIVKIFHASSWTLSLVFGIIGIIAVFKSHNDPISGYIANLYSLHSWIGMLVLSLYTIQFILGISSFSGLLSGHGERSSPTLMEIHKFAGAYIHILVTATILMGIQEKEGFVSCAYTVETADLTLHFGKIPHSCEISHGLGLVILFMGLCTSFGLARFPLL